MRRESNPGFPLDTEFSTIEGLEPVKDEVIEAAVERLAIMYSWRDRIESINAEAIVEHGLRDPANVFPKYEPHASRKAKTGAWRIICGLSVVDQLIERLLFKPWLELLVSSYPNLGMKYGIGFSDDHVEALVDSHKRNTQRYGPAKTNDISGFDSIHTLEMFEDDLAVMIGTCDVQDEEAFRAWLAIAKVRIATIVHIPWRIEGVVYECVKPGKMPSGSLMTTSTNSNIRLLMAYNVGNEAAHTVGDDCEEWPGAEDSAYADIGVKVRDSHYAEGDNFEFCSHKFIVETGRTKCQLVTWPKALFKFFSQMQPTEEQVIGLLYEFRDHDTAFREAVKFHMLAALEGEFVA